MTALSAFYPHLLPELPGCSVPLLDQHLLQVARDFCSRTSSWRADFAPIASVAATLAYTLVPPVAGAEFVRALKLTVNAELQWALVDPPCDDDQPRFRSDQPPFSINGDGNQITLTEQPTGVIQITASLRPTNTAATLPDLLYTQELEAMRTGTLARLLVMRNQPWTDREAAVFYAGEYTRRTSFAASKATGGNTRKPLRTRTWG